MPIGEAEAALWTLIEHLFSHVDIMLPKLVTHSRAVIVLPRPKGAFVVRLAVSSNCGPV